MRWLMEIIVPLVLFLCTLALVAVLFAAVVRYSWGGVSDMSIPSMDPLIAGNENCETRSKGE